MSCVHSCLLCSRQDLKQLINKRLLQEDCITYSIPFTFDCCMGIGICPCVDAVIYGTGEVSFHSGWTFHQAAGNSTDAPREVFTVIFMDKDMTMAEPINHNQRLDHERCALGRISSIR